MSSEQAAPFWADCWDARSQEMDPITDQALAQVWNSRSDRFSRSMSGEKKARRREDVTQLLDQAGFSAEGALVLDIGCGPGTLSIPLARSGATVTALDISSGMLERLQTTATEEDLDITTRECSWWTADIDALGYRKKFDLVIASMTPGVRDVITFNRMRACSKQYCYYSNFIQRDADRMHQEIYANILGEKPRLNAHGPGFLYPFMYLYTLGYQPLVTIRQHAREGEHPWEEDAQKAIDFLGSTRHFTEDVKARIRELYQSAASEGKYHHQAATFTGMMVWLENQKSGDQ